MAQLLLKDTTCFK